MKPTRRLSRRSFLGRVAGGAIIGGAALTVLGSTPAIAQTSDSDSGPTGDPAGRGRGRINDADSGQNGDAAGRGRGPRRATCTDRDSGARSDGVGHGRGNGVSDRDSGNMADAARCGRGPRRR
jgi:hypothetical protein